MTALRRVVKATVTARTAAAQSTKVFLGDVGRGLLAISHNTLALLGLAVVAGGVFVASRADVRHSIEASALGWLQARQEARAEGSPVPAATVVALPASPSDPAPAPAPIVVAVAATDRAAALPVAATEAHAVARATAADPRELTGQQSAVAHWLARRYKVAPEPISRLVKEAWNVAPRVGLDPTLILAIMAVESSFNPFAQSSVGAQGLMQVMTRVHNGKYERFGGILAAFDPVTNLKVGVQVLKECIARAGSVEAGLRYYVGAANQPTDGGYAGKVLAEQNHLRDVAGGRNVAANVRSVAPMPVAAAPAKVAAEGPEQVALAQ
jgi:soluble lytic murein transglycosylase-like protein